MEDHSELARGYVNTPSAREKSKNLWKELVNLLNCLGPVTRNVDGWKKVIKKIKILHKVLYISFFRCGQIINRTLNGK